MTNSIIYNPLCIFEQNPDKKGVCVPKTIVFTAAAATNDQSILAAITGTSFLVLSGNIRSGGATGAVTFKSASAGTNLYACQYPANTDNPKNEKLEPQPWGVFHTIISQGLFVDNSGVNIVTISLRYLEVIP